MNFTHFYSPTNVGPTSCTSFKQNVSRACPPVCVWLSRGWLMSLPAEFLTRKYL